MHGDGKSFACISLWLFSSRVVLDICLCWARLHAGQPIRFRSFSHDVPFNPISGSTVWFSCFTLFSISFSYVVCYCGNFQYICSSRLCVSVCAVWFESNVQRKKASVILFPFLGSFFPSSATTCVAHFSFCLSLFLELLSTWESRFIYALHVVRNDAKMHSSQEIPMFAAQCAHSTHSLTVVHFILCTLHTAHSSHYAYNIYVCKLPFRKPFDITRMLMFQVDENMQHFYSPIFEFQATTTTTKKCNRFNCLFNLHFHSFSLHFTPFV